MASINSLLFLFSTLAPNIGPPGNLPVNQVPPEWLKSPVLPYKDDSSTFCLENEQYEACGTACQKNCENYDKDISCVPMCESGCFCKEPLIRGPDGNCIDKTECPPTSNKVKHSFRNVCIDDLGCFGTGPPFYHPEYRPICVPPSQKLITQFLLYNPRYPIEPQVLIPTEESLKTSTLDPGLRTNILIYGYTVRPFPGDIWFEMKDEILKRNNMNVIIVDWSRDNQFPYPQAVANARAVGAQVAKFINYHVENKKLNPKSVHVIGHSLGAHLAGWAGERVPSLGRITGLDPAGPWFQHAPPEVRLDVSDAEFVDVIHTSGGNLFQKGWGLSEPLGHLDFYPNGGIDQPGCSSADTISPEDQTEELRNTPCRNSQECNDDTDTENEIKLRTIPGPFDNFKVCEDKNEVYKVCSSQCPDNCENYNDTRRACKLICLPIPKCECKEGLVRGPGGNCIEPENCPYKEKPRKNAELGFLPDFPRLSCKENETFSVCAPVCPDDCTNYQEDRLCKKICVPACKCLEGYVKGKDGNCIKKEDCEDKNSKLCEDKNEVYKVCPAKCPDTCENYKNVRRACKLICLPLPKCECKDGYVRGPNGNCIEPEQCPHEEEDQNTPCRDSQECGINDDTEKENEINLRAIPNLFDNFKICEDKNEIYKVCSAQCPDNCENFKDTRRACKLICLPLPKCECKDGFVRGPNGNCIEKEQCPQQQKNQNTPCRNSQECGVNDHKEKENEVNLKTIPNLFGSLKFCEDKNEVYKVCSSQCPDTCENYKDTSRPCKFICLPLPKCECEDGFVRGPNGICIKQEQCPQEEKDQSTPCRDSQECGVNDDAEKENEVNLRMTPNLFDNYKFCEDKNEVFKICSTQCPDNCENYKDTRRACKLNCLPVPKCECKDGFVRGPNGICIEPEQCPHHEIELVGLPHSCEHNRAPYLFLDSIINCCFFGVECTNYQDFLDGKCTPLNSYAALMGYDATKPPVPTEKTHFYLQTTEESPFCRLET